GIEFSSDSLSLRAIWHLLWLAATLLQYALPGKGHAWWLMPALGKVRTSPPTAMALIATTVQGIQLKAWAGLLKWNNAERVLLSKPVGRG
ncbi:MAG: hypothetical protein ACRC7Q_09240, partial [Plesiomonas shigelloides]